MTAPALTTGVPGTAATRAYKVLTGAEMAGFEAGGAFTGSAVDLADGYIHLSDAGQVTATVDKHFADQAGLFVIALDLTALGNAVRWEPSRGGALFPHVYGALPWAAVIAFEPLRRAADGAVALPG